MNENRHISPEALALFAMQLLEPEEEQAVLLHVSHCEYCRQELASLQGDLAVFALTAEVHSPPASARERLLTQVARERKVRRAERAEAGERGRGTTGEEREQAVLGGRRWGKPMPGGRLVAGEVLTRLLPWGGWAVAAGTAVLAGNLLHQRDALRGAMAAQGDEIGRLEGDAGVARQVLEVLTDRDAMRVTLTRSKEAGVPVGRVNYLPEKGSLVFVASDMAQLGPYKTYELWLIPADGRDPMPAGVFVPDAQGNASVILPSVPKGVPAKAFGITVEDEGGSPTPTMPIVMAGT